MIYLYAICDSPAPAPELPGLGGAPARLVLCGDIAAAVADLPAAPAPAEANLWAHEELVEALMADRTVLPARFATLLPDEAALCAWMERHRATLAADLARLAGCVELAVRGVWAGPAPEPPPAPPVKGLSGRDYMLARLAEERELGGRRAAAEAAHARLASLARAARLGRAPGPQAPLNGAYLLPAAAIESFRAAVAALDAAPLRLACTGPWPAYSFVTPLEAP